MFPSRTWQEMYTVNQQLAAFLQGFNLRGSYSISYSNTNRLLWNGRMFLLCHEGVSSESTLYSYLNVKELLVRSRRHIWKLTDCNGTRTHNHLVCEGTLNHLAKLASCSCFKMLGITLFLQCWKLFQYHGANYQLYLLSVLTKTWNKTTGNQPKRTKTIQNNPKLRNDPKF